MKRALSTIISLTLVVSSTGCSKDNKQETTATSAAQVSGILADPLLNKLPRSTEMFYVLDASNTAYQRLQDSPWVSSDGLKGVLERLKSSGGDQSQVAALQIFLSTLQNLGLVSDSGKSTVDKVISKAVVFAGLSNDAKQPIELGLYASAAKGASLKSKLPILRQVLGDADLVVSEQKIGGVDALVARPDSDIEGAPQEVAIYLAATDDLLAISATQSGAESLFSSANTDTIKSITDSAEFKKAAGAVGASASTVSFGYVDVKRLIPILEKFGSDNGASADDQAQLKQIPVDGIAMAQGFDKQLTTAISVAVSGRTDAQTKFLSALEGAAIPANLARLPSDTAFGFGFDTRFISKLADFLNSIQEADSAAAVQQAKDVQGVTFGVRNGDGTSPFPDVFLVVDAANRDNLATMAEAMIGQGMAEAAGAAPQWQSKDIDGTPTKFLTTMFGAGVYISTPKGSNSIVISSNERSTRDLLESSAGKKSGIIDSLQASLKDSLSPTKLLSVYFNGVQTASLVDSVKQSITTFTGPSPELDQSLDSAAIKKFGFATASVSYSNGLFLAESAFGAGQGN